MALLVPFGLQFSDSNGDPASGGSVYFYANGTTTPQTVYSDPELTTPLANPQTLDSSGMLTSSVFSPDGTSYTIAAVDSLAAALPGFPVDDVWGMSSVNFNADGDLSIVGNLVDIAPSADEDTGVKGRNTLGGFFVYVQNGTGNLIIRQTDADGVAEDTWITLTRNGGVTFNYDNAQKLAVTSTGITVSGLVDIGGGTELTIASGAVVVTTGYHLIDTESDAASDDLDTITFSGPSGSILVIRPVNAARTVVAKDGTGNLSLSGDFTMDNVTDTLTLIWSGSVWIELSRSDNDA